MRTQLFFNCMSFGMMLIAIPIFGQELPFSQVQANTFEAPFRGNLDLIGNHIISIRDRIGNEDDGYTYYLPNDDFDEVANNNSLVMDYVDIDDDNSTLSSSSAELSLPSSCSVIKYAGLYWTGTYDWKRQLYWKDDVRNGAVVRVPTLEVTPDLAYLEPNGTVTESNTGELAFYPDSNYGEDDGNPSNGQELDLPNPRTLNNADDFRYIKFKMPGADQPYIDITPTSIPAAQVRYDGFRGTVTNTSNFNTPNTPYVGYADVTDLLQDLADPSGTYTVGNVKTFTGQTSGRGTSAGWVLVITYEDPNEAMRYVSSSDGFATINAGDDPIMFTYSGFQTPIIGPVNAVFGIAALEGDQTIAGDALYIKGENSSLFTTLQNAVNPNINFFNGSVSTNGAHVLTRTPKSKNTLGFDLDLIPIPNTNNTVIGNNETGITIQTVTQNDGYATFLNTFAVEVIAPNIRITTAAEDGDENPIYEGTGVLLGDEITYVLAVENIGNDDAINTIIRDNIPENTSFIPGSVFLPATGVTFDYDAQNEQLVFSIADDVVQTSENGGRAIQIGFKVKVAASCNAIRNACSTEIKNTKVTSYEGRLSAISIAHDDDGIVTNNTCNQLSAVFSNFIVDSGLCTSEYETVLCSTESLLIGGANYDSYIWKNSEGIEIGTSQSIFVDQAGVYTLEAVANDCRNILETHTVVPFVTNDQNPLLPLADTSTNCSSDLSFFMPEFYLCGSDDERVLDLSDAFVNATTIAWERLNDDCSAPVVQGCPIAETAVCGYTTLGTDLNYTLTEPGKYRVAVSFANSCETLFFFDVFENLLDPFLVSRDIVCGTPGYIRVENVPDTGYEFSLALNGPYQMSNEFDISTPGEFSVYIRQSSGPCVFEERLIISETNTTIETTMLQPDCTSDNGGSIAIQLMAIEGNLSPPYLFSVTNGIFSDSYSSTEPIQTFSGLLSGTYTIEVSSSDGACTDMTTVTILEPPVFELTAVLQQDLFCGKAEIRAAINQMDPTGIYSFSLDNFTTTLPIGDVANPASNPPNYYLNNGDGTYTVFVATEGSFTLSVTDNSNGCLATASPIEVSEKKTCPTLRTQEIKNSTDITVYPNPTQGKVNISKTVDKIVVFNAFGKQVFQTRQPNFNIGFLPQGLYFIKLTKNNQSQLVKLTKR